MPGIKSFFRGRSKFFIHLLIIVLCVALLASLAGLVTSYSYPDQLVEEVVRAVVTQKIDLSYVALVKGSLIYDNRTVLQPGEVIYSKFLEGLNITYMLKLSSSNEVRSVEGSYEVYVNITSPIWSKKVLITSGSVKDLLSKAENVYVDFTYLKDYISKVEKEVGSSRAYTLSVIFNARTSIEVANISKPYFMTSTSKLELYYDTGKPLIDVQASTPESRYVDSVKQARPAEVPFLWFSLEVVTYRLLTTITSITSSVGLALTLILITRNKSSEKPLLTLFEERYRDLVVTGELEQVKHVVAVIRVRDFRDLIKVATMRKKPVVKLSDSNKIKFVIVDDNVTYLYEEVIRKGNV